MNTRLVLKAVVDRLRADASIYTAGNFTSICAGGIWSVIGPPSESTTFPFMVATVDMVANDDALVGNGAEYVLTLDIYDKRENGIVANLETLLARVYGDGAQVPTYGLHRHLLVLPTGATNPLSLVGNTLIWNSTREEVVDQNVLKATCTFGGRISTEQ